MKADPKHTFIAAGVVLPLLLVCVVALQFEYLPFVDLPNHLARDFILIDDTRLEWMRREFITRWTPTPNVLADVVVVGLGHVIGVMRGAKALFVLTQALWLAAVIAISLQVHRRLTLVAIPAAFLSLHGAQQYGFMSYSLGLPLAFIGIAVWLEWRRSPSAGWLVAVIGTATLTYLSHLADYGVLGVACGSVMLWEWRAEKKSLLRGLASLLPLMTPLPLFVYFMGHGGKVGAIQYSALSERVVSLFSCIRSYNLPVDLVVAVCLLAFLVGALLAAARGRTNVSPRLLAAVAGLTVAYILLPKIVLTASGVDGRIPPAMLFLLLMAVDDAHWPRWVQGTFIALTVALSVRQTVMVRDMASLSRYVARHLELGASLKPGDRVLPFHTESGNTAELKRQRVLLHAPYYFVIERGAYVPMLFASPSQQPLVARRWGNLTIDSDELLERHRSEFDYLLVSGTTVRKRLGASGCCTVVAENETGALLRLNR